MRSGAWSQSRDIAAALASWERAARIADVLPADDEDRLAMRIAPRTRLCANGWRSHKPIAGKRFEELQDLCAAAGDKASVAIATTGLLGEHLMNGRLAEASRLVSEYMVLIESIGDPTLTVRLALLPIAGKIRPASWPRRCAGPTRSSIWPRVTEPCGGYIVDPSLASAYALRCTARWGWDTGLARRLQLCRRDGSRCRSAIASEWSSPTPTANASDVVSLPPTMLHYATSTRRCRARSDRLTTSLSASPCTRRQSLCCIAIPRSASADWTYRRQLREMAVDGRFYPYQCKSSTCVSPKEMIRRGDRDAVPLLRASVDALYSSELLGYWLWGTGVLVEALLECGTDSDVQEAEAAVDRLSTQPMLDGWACRDLILLRLRLCWPVPAATRPPIETSPTATAIWRHRLASRTHRVAEAMP